VRRPQPPAPGDLVAFDDDPFRLRLPIVRRGVHRLDGGLQALAAHRPLHPGVIDEALVGELVDELDLALPEHLPVEAPDDLACVRHASADDTTVSEQPRGVGGTRERNLAAARAIVVEEGCDRLSLERVAERAGVVRAAIYYQFGSKPGLTEGLTEGLVGAIELDVQIHESRRHDRSFAQLLRRVTAIWEHESDLLPGVVNLTVTDAQTREVILRHQRGRRQRICELVEQLERAGHLHADPDDATDLLWHVTSFQAYDYLRRTAARSHEDVRMLLETLAASVIDPQAPTG